MSYQWIIIGPQRETKNMPGLRAYKNKKEVINEKHKKICLTALFFVYW